MQRFFKVVKNTNDFSNIFQSGEKYEWFFKVVKNTKIFQSGLIVMGNLLRWKMRRFFQSGEKYEWFFKVMKNAKIFQSGEKYKDFSKWSICNERPFKCNANIWF
jgi:6-phosphogluconate dehydrogenase